MQKIILSIDGMTCSACSGGLEKYLNKQNGIYNAAVNLVMANATIEYDEKILNLQKLEEFVKKAGFKSLGEFKEIKFEKKETQKAKFIFFTGLAIILMYVSMGHMLGLPQLFFADPHKNPRIYAFILFALAIPFLIYGRDILKNGWKNLIHKTPNMDTLVGIGVLTSFFYSVYNMFLMFFGKKTDVATATMNLYFESAAIIIYFIKLGRFIDGVSKDKTKDAIGKLATLTPAKAVKKIDGEFKEVALDEIKKNDILACKAGEKIAVDGEIITGAAHFDESFLTGESRSVTKGAGEKVLAGSVNFDGYIEYKAEKIGRESTISEIVRLVVEATNTKPPVSKFADKISGIFVPVVFAIAIITFLFYLIARKNLSDAIITFTTILVAACPCSLGLATPLAVVVSEGLCAQNGILIKKSDILEKAGKTNAIVFDKTGTLTYGKLKISKIKNFSALPDEKIIQLAGSVEKKSNHPISSAFADYMIQKNIEILDVTDYQNVAGLGIKAKINSQEINLGNSKLVDSLNAENPHKKDEEELSREGNSIVYVIQDKKTLAIIAVNDILRENAKEVIAELEKNNIETIMLTGDNENVARKIADEAGIAKVISDVLPSQKAEIIKNLKKQNKITMMCGDGINDSPALTNSDIGVSIKSGTDIAMDSSDVILTQNDLAGVLKLINISKKTFKIIKENLFWAFFYNLLMIPIAQGVFKPLGISVTPMVASFAMVCSSLTVILNTLRLKIKST